MTDPFTWLIVGLTVTLKMRPEVGSECQNIQWNVLYFLGAEIVSIEFIYFDLGKVIVDFDHDIACHAIGEAAGLEPQEVMAAVFDSGYEIKYENGLISCDEFHHLFSERTKTCLEKEEFLNYIGDVFSPIQKMFPLLTQLRAMNFPMGILSNTCPAHWHSVVKSFTVVREFFSPVILSYEVMAMKPDPKIYETAIVKAGCQSQNCFFVDDRQENVQGAIDAGMDAVLYTGLPDLMMDLERRGVDLNL